MHLFLVQPIIAKQILRGGQRLDNLFVLLSIRFAARLLLCSCLGPLAGAGPDNDSWGLARSELGLAANRRRTGPDERRRPAGSPAASAAYDDGRFTLFPTGDNEPSDPVVVCAHPTIALPTLRPIERGLAHWPSRISIPT